MKTFNGYDTHDNILDLNGLFYELHGGSKLVYVHSEEFDCVVMTYSAYLLLMKYMEFEDFAGHFMVFIDRKEKTKYSNKVLTSYHIRRKYEKIRPMA